MPTVRAGAFRRIAGPALKPFCPKLIQLSRQANRRCLRANSLSPKLTIVDVTLTVSIGGWFRRVRLPGAETFWSASFRLRGAHMMVIVGTTTDRHRRARAVLGRDSEALDGLAAEVSSPLLAVHQLSQTRLRGFTLGTLWISISPRLARVRGILLRTCTLIHLQSRMGASGSIAAATSPHGGRHSREHRPGLHLRFIYDGKRR